MECEVLYILYIYHQENTKRLKSDMKVFQEHSNKKMRIPNVEIYYEMQAIEFEELVFLHR